MSAPRVSVLIVTYNSAHLSDRCFAALAAQTMADFEAIVVDNASTDGGPKLPNDPRFRLIRSDKNLGFAAGNNLAAREAKGAWLATLNPDAFAEPNWLAALLAAVETHPGATMAGSTQIDFAHSDKLDGAGDCYHALGIAWRGLGTLPRDLLPPTGEVFGPCAAAALYRADAFRAVGGFDEAFFCYHEDVDLALRLRLIGGRCVQSAEAVVHHVGSAISGKQSDFAVYHGVRNRIWTFYQGMPLPLLVLLAAPQIAANVLLALKAPKSFSAATWRGLRDGYGGLGRVLFARRRAVQRTRTASSGAIARALTWSVRKLLYIQHDVRPWSGAKAEVDPQRVPETA